MTKEEHNCDNVNCNHNNTKGLCCLFNPDNCKYRQLQKENAELKVQLESDRDLPVIAYMQGAEKQKKKDEEELKKWKDEWQEQVQKATDEDFEHDYSELIGEAEQFLSEVAK